MPDSNSNEEPRNARVRASITTGVPIVHATVRITPADTIEVGESDQIKYLRLRTGDFSLNKRVFLIVEGQRREITVDSLPDEGHDDDS